MPHRFETLILLVHIRVANVEPLHNIIERQELDVDGLRVAVLDEEFWDVLVHYFVRVLDIVVAVLLVLPAYEALA